MTSTFGAFPGFVLLLGEVRVRPRSSVAEAPFSLCEAIRVLRLQSVTTSEKRRRKSCDCKHKTFLSRK